ncbi:MAG: hypothetical protein K8S54_07640 [Spirochaetia bacterium]|nr:hypothetical protein [Spirochaetia bacterium]
MLDKLSFPEIIKYLFTSIILLFSLVIATGTTIQDLSWIPWTDAKFPEIITPILAILIGYICFTAYRGLVYEFLVIWFKGGLEECFSLRTPRTFIRAVIGRKISIHHSEQLYSLIKLTDLSRAYKELGGLVPLGLHLFYFGSFTMLVGGIFGCSLCYVFVSCCALIVTLFMDFRHERLEFLIFHRHADRVRDSLRLLKYGPLDETPRIDAKETQVFS